eukprot:TRINITY_DN13500_c0_g1_i1.p1 TRINITY_DN13500_c0_g1~~TRINITY_DN13500_c0_g1_i1.p1  ORF type:complete len:249 (+),score=56.76 TRINITY_DN13500_c0_g1_i1:84-830(+)
MNTNPKSNKNNNNPKPNPGPNKTNPNAAKGPAPNPLLNPQWKERTHNTHLQHLEALKQPQNSNFKVLLLGSSMIERFETSGKSELPKLFQESCFLAGVGGDGVQHMLYRVHNGLIEACPDTLETVVLMSGTNNIEKFSEEQTLEAVSLLINTILLKRPSLKIILFGLPPRDSTVKKYNNAQLLEKVQRFNKLLESLQSEQIRFFNFYEQLVYNTGRRMDGYFDDHVHLNAKGYTIFAQNILDALKPTT